MATKRKTCPSTDTDEEWAFVAPYLTLINTLMNEEASQRVHPLAPPLPVAVTKRWYDLGHVAPANALSLIKKSLKMASRFTA